MAVGAGISAYAQAKSGSDAKRTAEANAAAALDSAKEEGRARIQQAARDAGDIAAQGAQIAAQHDTAQGASNVSGGTTDAAKTVSMLNNIRDQATVKANAAREAWGLKRQAQVTGQAMVNQGRAAQANGMLSAAGTIVGATGQVVGMYANRPATPKAP